MTCEKNIKQAVALKNYKKREGKVAQITKLESTVALPEHEKSKTENPKGNLGSRVVEWAKDNKTEIMIVTAGVAAAALILSTGGLGTVGVLGVLAVVKICAIILGGTAIGVPFIAGASIGVQEAQKVLNRTDSASHDPVCESLNILIGEIPVKSQGSFRVPGKHTDREKINSFANDPVKLAQFIKEQKAKSGSMDLSTNDDYAGFITGGLKLMLLKQKFIPAENPLNLLNTAKARAQDSEKTFKEFLNELTPEDVYRDITKGLSPEKIDVLNNLIAKLSILEENKEVTLMTLENISISIGPSLLLDPVEGGLTGYQDYIDANQILIIKLIEWHRAQSN